MSEIARRGKIARLPQNIREDLNLRLMNGEPGSVILPWLNGLAETQTILTLYFAGEAITDNNLSSWRHGGFAEWTKKRSRVAELRELSKFAKQCALAANGTLSEGAAAIAGGQILELLDLIRTPDADDEEASAKDAEMSVEDRAARESARVKNLLDLTSALTALRRGDQEVEKLKHATEKLKQGQAALDLANKEYHRKYTDDFIKHFNDAEIKAAMTAGKGATVDREKLMTLLFGKNPNGPDVFTSEV